jgi:hypothetical protein
MPSVLAQTLARYSSSPYAFHRLRLGPGAGAYLGQGLFVPLEINGSVKSQPSTQVATVNALDLMTGGLADGISAADQAILGKGKIIVIGSDHQIRRGRHRPPRGCMQPPSPTCFRCQGYKG